MIAHTTSLDEALAWATLASLRLPIDPAWVLERVGPPSQLFQLSPKDIVEKLGWPKPRADKVASQKPEVFLPFLEKFQAEGGSLITFDHPLYPPLLKQISSPPAALWCRGRPQVLSAPQVAIVGTRRPSDYGLEVARSLALELAARGIGVASGGAHGIDAAAHHGALEARGHSIAVFGTGIDKVYPADHVELYRSLEGAGACITEFSPGVGPRPEHFPIRNRLISGLSLAVVVVEAGVKSGALITARFALDQNRELMAVPGSIFSPSSQGTHQLLRSGAQLVGGVEDILREIAAHLPSEQRLPVESRGSSPVTVALEGDLATLYELLERPSSIDGLVEKSKLSISTVSHLLLELEISGVVVALPGQQYCRSKSASRGRV